MRESELEKAIFKIQNEEDFNRLALEIYHFQTKENLVYKSFIHHLNRKNPTHYSEIPCLPISFFKTHKVYAGDSEPETFFLSSGTQGTRSKHEIKSLKLYEASFLPTYTQQIGNPSEQVILALLPNYVEQGNSSLVYMVDKLIEASASPLSGFYLQDIDLFKQNYKAAISSGKKPIIFGVSYALLDLTEQGITFSEAQIIETGGMKGRRKEMSKEEMHEILKNAFQVKHIASEYGMCELLSQAYSNEAGLFEMPPWMRIQLRETSDPFQPVKNGKTGGINVFDLANLYSCSFISTQDLGKIEDRKLRLMGRFDHADIRGCNLMVE